MTQGPQSVGGVVESVRQDPRRAVVFVFIAFCAGLGLGQIIVWLASFVI